VKYFDSLAWVVGLAWSLECFEYKISKQKGGEPRSAPLAILRIEKPY